LNGKAYVGRSVIADAQETINLYGELNTADSGAPVPITYYQTPGSTLVSTPNTPDKNRCTYRTSLGTAFTVIGGGVYFVATNNALVYVGGIPNLQSQVYMADNGLVAVLVDGTGVGYAIDLATNDFGIITDPSFYGADYVVYLLTFFVFNRPKTNQFYISLSQVNFAMLTGIAIGTGFISNPGSGGILGLYQNVPLTGGSGTGATADIQVLNGVIATGHISAGGAGYVNGFYPGVALGGGAGTGIAADITVAGNAVTSVVFTGVNDLYGSGSLVNDVLTCPNTSLGGTGAGFTWTVDTIANAVSGVVIDTPGENYLVGDVLSANSAAIGNVVGFTWTVETVALAFDPLDIAAKSGSADPIVAILSVHEELWLIGSLTTEVWQGTGAADFFFQQVQGAYIEHGCTAQYSASFQDVLGFWISQDRQGKNIIVQGSGYDVKEISTPYLVNQLGQYSDVSDAIGFCFQISGHPFYCITFPTQNITWLYELQTKQWNKWLWLNTSDGSLNRHRANCAMFFNGNIVIGDWQNGNLYTLSSEVYTDFGSPIIRIKTFIHMLDNLDRTIYRNFDLDIECGTQDPTLITIPIVYLSWSDDRGITYGYPVPQTMGEGGQFKTVVTWNRLAYARDRIFKCQWSEPLKTALNGGFCEVVKART
jgi:hypothetical protein